MRHWLLGWALICLGCSSVRQARPPRADEASLRVLTYNLNFGMAGDAQTIDIVRRADADVVVLQETTPRWEAAIRHELSDSYPHMTFRHCCLAGGLGILSKSSYEEQDYLEAPSGWFPAWRLVVDSPLGPLQVLNLHLRPPVSESGSVVSGYFTTPAIREREIETYHATLERDLPTLILGDFNENDTGRALTYLREHGFRSALPEFDDDAETWHWATPLGTVHAQLDHIVYDAKLEPLSARVIPGGHSDHFAVLATFHAAPLGRDQRAPCGTSLSGC